MGMPSIGPARRRQGDQIMREIHKDIDQIPMPDRIGIGIGATLNPPIIHVPALHVMADQQPGPGRQSSRGGSSGQLERGGGLVEGVVEGLEVGPGVQVVHGLDGVGDGRCRLEVVDPWMVGGGGGGGVVAGRRMGEGRGLEESEEALEEELELAHIIRLGPIHVNPIKILNVYIQRKVLEVKLFNYVIYIV